MLRHAVIIVGSVSTLVLASSGTALADTGWGGVECGQVDYAGCQLGAGQGDQPGHSPSSPQRPESGEEQDSGSSSEGSSSPDSAPQRPQGDQIVGDDPNLANCRYVPSDYQPPNQGTVTIGYHPPQDEGAVTAVPALYRSASAVERVRPVQQQQPPPGQSGSWYIYKCSGGGWRDQLYRPPIWIPDDQQAPAPSPEQVAQQAYNQLRLPSPRIHTSPDETQLVNLPTWLWMDRGQWRSQTVTASVPGVSVTATAIPRSVTWSMGDGSTITCQGAGTPFPAGSDPKAASPDCGHTYRQTSQGRSNNTYPVTATVHWTVTWSGAGQGGTFPDLTTISRTSFAVAESQALNNAPN